MIIAVTHENGQVFQHFGHTEQFKLYETENNKVTDSNLISTLGEGHSALAGLLGKYKVDVLICGGIGEGARRALLQNGIEIRAGVKGDTDEAVEKLLKGKLEYTETANCDHHDHEHEHAHIHDGEHTHTHGGCAHHCNHH